MVSAVRHAVQTGEYASQNDAVQDAIRYWANERSAPSICSTGRLRALWEEAVQDNSDGLDPDEFFNGLEEKYEALARSEQRG